MVRVTFSKSVASSASLRCCPGGVITAGEEACTRSSVSTSRAWSILCRSTHRSAASGVAEGVAAAASPAPSTASWAPLGLAN